MQLWLLHRLGCKFPGKNTFMLAAQIYDQKHLNAIVEITEKNLLKN